MKGINYERKKGLWRERKSGIGEDEEIEEWWSEMTIYVY